jgi:hypothetical protein
MGSHNGISDLLRRERPELSFSFMWRNSKKATACKPGGESSLGVQMGQLLDHGIPNFQNWKIESCCLSHPVYSTFLWRPKPTKKIIFQTWGFVILGMEN